MQSIRLFAVALFLCVPASLQAAPDATPAPRAKAEAQPEKPKKICRMETATGSVMPKRVCRTPEQVAADEEAARRTREQLDRR